MTGANGKPIYVGRVPTNDLAGFSTLLKKAENIEFLYAHVPLTEDYEIQTLVKDHVELMSNEFALSKGVPASQEQVPQQAHAPAMGTQARVLTSGSTAQPASAPVSSETFVQNLPKMTNDQLYGLLGEPDGRRVLK